MCFLFVGYAVDRHGCFEFFQHRGLSLGKLLFRLCLRFAVKVQRHIQLDEPCGLGGKLLFKGEWLADLGFRKLLLLMVYAMFVSVLYVALTQNYLLLHVILF